MSLVFLNPLAQEYVPRFRFNPLAAEYIPRVIPRTIIRNKFKSNRPDSKFIPNKK